MRNRRARLDNIITSEDDSSAIITRWLVEPEAPMEIGAPKPPLNGLDPVGEPIVEWRRQSLASDDKKFTTLSALYQMTQIILAVDGVTGFDEKHMVNRPTDKQLQAGGYEFVAGWWAELLHHVYAVPAGWPRDNPRLLPDYRSLPG